MRRCYCNTCDRRWPTSRSAAPTDAVRHAVAPTGIRYPALLRQLAAYLGVEDMP